MPTIPNLGTAATLTTADLFVVDQTSGTRKATGQQLRDFLGGGTGDGNVIGRQTQIAQAVRTLKEDGNYRDPLLIGTGVLTVGSPSSVVDNSKYNSWATQCRLLNGQILSVFTEGDTHHLDNSGKVMGMLGTETFNGYVSSVSWGTPFTIYDDPSMWCEAMGVTQGHDGRVIVTFYRNNVPSTPLDGALLVYSDDVNESGSAAVWSAPVTVNAGFTDYSYMSSRALELPDGRWAVAVEGEDTGDTYSSIRVLFSADNGATWGSEVILFEDGLRNYYELCWQILDDGSVGILLRTTDSDGTTYWSRSTDGLATASAPAAAYAGHAQPNFVQLSTRTLISVTRKNEGVGAGDLIAYTSIDRGATWSALVDLDTTMYESMYGCPLELFDGRVHVIYGSQPTSSGSNSDIKQVIVTETRATLARNAVKTLTDGANIAVDASRYDNFRVTLGGNRTLDNPTGLYSGQVINFRVHQDGTGSRTLAYGSKYKFAGGAPTLSTAANAKDFISCQYDATDDTLYCAISKAMA